MDDTMQKDDMSDDIIDTNRTILSDHIFAPPQKLTPTGKISHAKTRVYTQRYRKEWEQMPDFKGWLTSVPLQPTRAFCTYCKKNLHAHRLSLLKHTCTMKHQRAALLAQNEANKKCDDPDKMHNFEEVTIVSAIKSLGNEEEENEDFEYVVESLEIEEEEEEVNQSRQDDSHDEEDSLTLPETHEEEKPRPKKIKLEPAPRRDTLAEAMAHVHGEYLEPDEEQAPVELEMVVESETTILPDKNDENADHDNQKFTPDKEIQIVDVEQLQKPKIVAYKFNSPNASVANIQISNAVTLAPSQAKCISLNTGKTVTLTTGKSATGGTQYVLSKVKGNLPALMVSGAKTINQRSIAPKTVARPAPTSVAVAGTSANVQDAQKQPEKPSEPVVKNPCISTHVLDTSKGTPITGLQVSLYKLMDGRWTFLNESTTNGNGRCTDLVNTTKSQFTAGRYKMHFDVDKYFTLRRIETMYPFIEIVFDVKNPTGNYHIPILLSPYSYTTYRGSDR